MSRITPISVIKFKSILEKAGFNLIRVEGDHFIYHKVGILRPLVIPDWDELPVFIIKNNLRTAGISREEYFELLNK